MQEKYVGDTPDFGKYALLRALCVGSDDRAPLRLGVNWYLTLGHEVDRANNTDGEVRHHASKSDAFKPIDPDLWHRLDEFQHRGNRTIAGIEKANVLPADTLYFSEPLTLASFPQKEKAGVRAGWVQRGVAGLADADVVFVDPDNGFETPSQVRHRKTGPKYVFYDEVTPYLANGLSVVAIQFANQSEKVFAMAKRVTKGIRQQVGFGGELLTVRCRAGKVILYFILCAPPHRDILTARLDGFLARQTGHVFERL